MFSAFPAPVSSWTHLCGVLIPLGPCCSDIISDDITSENLAFFNLLALQTGVPDDFLFLTNFPVLSCWWCFGFDFLKINFFLTNQEYCFGFVCCSPSGAQEQPMEESYEEAVTKDVEQEWTCLDFQQLPCWTVMEDMPRM